MKKPIVMEKFTNTGEHSHWELVNAQTGETLWEEDRKKDAFCSNCQAFIVDERVTYDECCDTCKFKVSYI